jgi:DNA-binding winged helix-turn-helix (wHTH) protein
MKKTAMLIALFLTSTLLMQFVWYTAERGKETSDFSSEKMNLALRRVAHQLLKCEGDSTSRIPPVEQVNASAWLLRLERNFKYDSLPNIMQTSFKAYNIGTNYDVALLKCDDGQLLLGYNYFDFIQNKDAPCMGRSASFDCYNLQVTLSLKERKMAKMPLMGWVFSTSLAIILFGLAQKWQFKKKKKEETTPKGEDTIQFGNTRFNTKDSLLFCGDVSHQLTYREAKLLRLFISHQNQVLERAFILENVWADEGILVGRSVDMFVSRLRKILNTDSSVRLIAVHGVGYKMEINKF